MSPQFDRSLRPVGMGQGKVSSILSQLEPPLISAETDLPFYPHCEKSRGKVPNPVLET